MAFISAIDNRKIVFDEGTSSGGLLRKQKYNTQTYKIPNLLDIVPRFGEPVKFNQD